jgi:hypothetical protein
MTNKPLDRFFLPGCKPEDAYVLTFHEKLLFVVVQVSDRRYVVAQYSGHAHLMSLPRVGKNKNEVQGGFSFRVITRKLSVTDADDVLAYCYELRFPNRDPLILEGEKGGSR